MTYEDFKQELEETTDYFVVDKKTLLQDGYTKVTIRRLNTDETCSDISKLGLPETVYAELLKAAKA